MSQSTFLSEALFSTKWDIGNWYQFLLTTKREFNQQEIKIKVIYTMISTFQSEPKAQKK